jgi:deoxyribose-phosphate aldolase
MKDPFAALADAQRAPQDAAVAQRLLPLLDLTSLRGDETPQEIAALARRALASGCAAVCVYPRMLEAAREILAGRGVRLAAVVNFPDGSDDLARVRAETRTAVALGADEIDVVAPLAATIAGDVELVGDIVRVCREVAGANRTIKIILETGLLAAPALITAAARSAVMAGADFLKTSTGMRTPGATRDAAALLLAVVQEAGGRIGLKLSGGIRTLADAAPYLALVDAAMGVDWVSPAHLRFGSSRLLDDLEAWLGRR